MTADLIPRAFGIPARLLVSLLAVAALTAAVYPSPALAVLVDGVDLQVRNVQYLQEFKESHASCRGSLCRDSSDETERAAVLYSLYNQGDQDSWGIVVHLRIDGKAWKQTQEHSDGLESNGWIHHYFEIPPLTAGTHELEIGIQAIPERGTFARIPVDADPSNDRMTVEVVVNPTL